MGKLQIENRLPPQVTEAAWEFSVHHNDIIMLYREADLLTRIVQEVSSDTKISLRRLLGAIGGQKSSTDEVQTEGISSL